MKITKQYLRKIIKEEVSRTLKEGVKLEDINGQPSMNTGVAVEKPGQPRTLGKAQRALDSDVLHKAVIARGQSVEKMYFVKHNGMYYLTAKISS
jgi:hypothetical protein